MLFFFLSRESFNGRMEKKKILDERKSKELQLVEARFFQELLLNRSNRAEREAKLLRYIDEQIGLLRADISRGRIENGLAEGADDGEEHVGQQWKQRPHNASPRDRASYAEMAAKAEQVQRQVGWIQKKEEAMKSIVETLEKQIESTRQVLEKEKKEREDSNIALMKMMSDMQNKLRLEIVVSIYL